MDLTDEELSYIKLRLYARRSGLAARRRKYDRTGHGFRQQDEHDLCYGIEMKILDEVKRRREER